MSGCPMCGYSNPPEDDDNDAAGSGIVKAKKKKKKKESVAGLPLWVYILTTAIFTAILAALLFRVF